MRREKKVTNVLLFVVASLYASRISPAQSDNAYFAQVAIGGGYSTVFTLLNTGNTVLTGNLILTGQDGNPLRASLIEGVASVTDSNLPVTIQPGGTKIIVATARTPSDSTQSGWARVASTGGKLGAVATFQQTGSSGELQTIAGVLSSSAVSIATVPVDDDVSADRFTGFALANTGTTPIIVAVREVNPDGSAAATLNSVSLGPRKQVAAFLFQDPNANQKFLGSAVFTGDNNASFCIVGLAMNQGLLTAIPVIPSAATPQTALRVTYIGMNGSSVTGGDSIAAEVGLDGVAPSGGVQVSLSSDNSAAQVPSTVTVPAGQRRTGFTISTRAVTSIQTATITASLGTSRISISLKIGPGGSTNPFAGHLFQINGTVTLEGRSVRTKIVLDSTFAQYGLNSATADSTIDLASPILFFLGFNKAAFSGFTATHTGLDSTLSIYTNITKGATIHSVVSGTLKITISSTSIGSAVSGQLTFTLDNGTTLDTNVTGTIVSYL
jgi:hypothetical protein